MHETKVEVNILNSPPLVLSVPGELELQDPTFIEYVAQVALDKYKDMVRYVKRKVNFCVCALLTLQQFSLCVHRSEDE